MAPSVKELETSLESVSPGPAPSVKELETSLESGSPLLGKAKGKVYQSM